MIKFIIPAVLVILIVFFWEKINKFIFDKFKIKLNNLLVIAVLLVIASIIILLKN